MIQILVFCIIGLFLICYYFPKRRYDNYVTTLRNMGYRVYAFSFNPLGFQNFIILDTDLKQHNDAMHTAKHQFVNYDLAVGNLFSRIYIQVLSPQLLKQFYSMDKVYVYQKSRTMHALFVQVLGKGLICSQGNAWKSKRKMLNIVFNFDYLVKLIPTLVQCADRNIEMIKSQHFKESKVTTFDLRPSLIKMSGSVSVFMFFGNQSEKLNEIAIRQAETLIHLVEETGHLFAMAPQVLLIGPALIKLRYRKSFRNFLQLQNECNISLDSLIKQSLQRLQTKEQINKQCSEKKQSILQSIQIWNKKAEKCQKYSLEDIRNEFANLHFASSDTTANFILVMLYCLDIYSQVKTKILRQKQLVIKQESDISDYSKLKKLKYFDCFQKEVIRFYGSANRTMIREAVVDHKLKDIPIYKGTNLMGNNYPNHFNPQYFQQPFQFKPERWLDDAENQLLPFVYLGFSGGPRSCIGKNLAILESKIYVLKFMKIFSLELSGDLPKFSATSIYIPTPAQAKITLL